MVHIVATAFASKVFPVPGGPYRSRPERHRPSDSSSGCSRGNWIVSRISFFTSWSPPTSCQDTDGTCQERESAYQHFFLTPEQTCVVLFPVQYSVPLALSGYAARQPCAALPSHPGCGICQHPQYLSPKLCNGKNHCTCSQGSCMCSLLSHLKSSVGSLITRQQKYPRESICQDCLQLCGERTLMQTALGTHDER